MKRFFILCFVVFISISTNAQETYIGKINPVPITGARPYYCLRTLGENYKLTLNQTRIQDSMIVNNIKYFFDDIVSITGTVKPSYPGATLDFELEIDTIKKWSKNQDIQHFLGTYYMVGNCKEVIYNFTYTGEYYFIIKEGVESDLLIGDLIDFNGFKVYTFDDCFYIPVQKWKNYDGTQASFEGKGKIKDDSLFLDHASGGSAGVSICECKGARINTAVVPPPNLNNNRIYYDASKQEILIDLEQSLQNQSLNFELFDVQGRTVLKKTIVGNTNIKTLNLPKGIYLYRLSQNNQIVYSGKVWIW